MEQRPETQELHFRILLAAVDPALRSMGPQAAEYVRGLVAAGRYESAVQAIVELLRTAGDPVPRGVFDHLSEVAGRLGMGPSATEPLRVLIVEGPIALDTSAALQERSLTRLREGFKRHVQAASAQPHWDQRDEMLGLTPFLDCARRLGHDPAIELGPIARTGAPWLAALFAKFVRRSDVTLAAFGWSIVETPSGPAYRFEWPKWQPPAGDRTPDGTRTAGRRDRG